MKIREIFKISSVPVLIASLCCLSPVVIVIFGLGTVGFASSLADTLYGQYKWYFRIAGLIAMALALIIYFRRQNICTLDEAVKRRNEIINIVAISLVTGILGYIFFLYVVVHYAGVWLSLWK